MNGAREHIRSNFMSYLALFCFAMGGTAKAVDGPLEGQNTVGSEDIIGNEILSDDIGNGRIFNLDIADDIIQTDKVLDGSLTGADFATNTVTGLDIDEASLFNDNSVTTADIDDSALFNDDTVAANDLAANSIGATEAATDSVGSSEAGPLQAADFVQDAVASSELAAGSVGQSELVDVSVVIRTEEVGGLGTADFLVACPAGAVAIGGSASSVDHDVRINSSFASESTTTPDFPEDGDGFVAWWGRFHNDGVLGALVDTFVICVEAS